MFKFNQEVPFLEKRSKKNLIGEISVVAVALAILLTILIPTISKCIENSAIKKCTGKMTVLTDALNAAVNDEKTADKWLELLKEKRSQQILSALKLTMDAQTANSIDLSDYYLRNDNGELKLLCIKHPDIEGFSVTLPEKLALPTAAPSNGEFIDHLQITGVRTYLQNESINPDAPEQMRFTADDNLQKIFSDITVKIIYVGGGEKILSPNQYDLSTDGFDMTTPGTKRIKISYSEDKVWIPTTYTEFTFEVLKKAQCDPLLIDFGEKGSYELAAWDWSDYVAEATQSEGSAKDFDASIVHYEGDYYYYPDGFNIDGRRENLSPETSAADIDDPTIAAYRIPFNTDVIINSKEDETEMRKAVEGALMLEEEQVYIWQIEPSKELETGWIRVFCEFKKK